MPASGQRRHGRRYPRAALYKLWNCFRYDGPSKPIFECVPSQNGTLPRYSERGHSSMS
jgi:hypothetical protein